MSDYDIRLGDQGLGAYESATVGTIDPLSGNTPENTTSHAVDPAAVVAADLPAFSVVGLNANGLTLAKFDKSVQAIGITVVKVDKGSTAAHVGIFRDGTWDPAALTWDATFDTDAKKKAAFDGAPTPTSIFIKPKLY